MENDTVQKESDLEMLWFRADRDRLIIAPERAMKIFTRVDQCIIDQEAGFNALKKEFPVLNQRLKWIENKIRSIILLACQDKLLAGETLDVSSTAAVILREYLDEFYVEKPEK